MFGGKYRKFLSDRAGNFTIATTILLVPLIVAAGLAVDLTRVEESKNQIQNALDAGTMAAAVKMNEGSTEADAIEEGIRVFAANCDVPDCTTGADPEFVVTPGEKVTGTRATTLDTTLLKISNIDSADFNALSEVNLNFKYQYYYFAIDSSASLGIASDSKNIAKLMELTKPYLYNQPDDFDSPNGCAFACHELVGFEPNDSKGNPIDTYQMAQDAGIELREDVLLAATYNAADTILQDITGTHADQIKVGAYAFSDTLEKLANPTANSTNIKTKIGNSSIRHWGTRYDVVLPELAKDIGASGTGSTKKDPTKTLILITDGVWSDYDTTDPDWNKAFDSSWCDDFKKNGVRVVVIDVEYPRLDGELPYENYVKPFVEDISPGLEACATDGYYYTANDTPEIQAVLNKMAKKVKQADLAFVK